MLHSEEILDTLNTAIQAGLATLEVYNSSDFEVQLKSDASPLTKADVKSHQVIVQALQKTGLPILSEEGKQIPYQERKLWDSFWLVDPIDGTKEFIKRNGEFTINIALIQGSKPIFGVIYVPVSGDLYWGGSVVQASYKINTQCLITSVYTSLLAEAKKLPMPQNSNVFKVVCSKSFLNPETQDYIDALKQQHPNIEKVSRGSSLKICMVAEGEAQIYPRLGPTMEWDVAAGHAIAIGAQKNIYILNQPEFQLIYNKPDLLNPYFIVK